MAHKKSNAGIGQDLQAARNHKVVTVSQNGDMDDATEDNLSQYDRKE